MKRVHIKLEPVNIAKLIGAIGDKEAAQAVGITPQAINRYIKAWQAPKAVEIAAGSFLHDKQTTAIISGSPDIILLIKTALKNSSGSYTELKP